MNPFVSKINRGSWELPVGALCLLLGAMISLTLIKPNTRSGRYLDESQRSRLDASDSSADEKLSARVNTLLQDNTKLQNAIADKSKQGQVLNQQLQEVKAFAGLTDVEGPGVIVTLRDSTKSIPTGSFIAPSDRIIHDDDVLRVVNELWASGAEAIAVNNHRVSVGSSFRCVGPVILVDGDRIASPINIRAIGDGDTLMGGLNIPDGVLDQLRQLDPAMVDIEKAKFDLPAYTGSTDHPLVTVPKESK